MTLLYYHHIYITNENSYQDYQQTAGTTLYTHLRTAFSHTSEHLCPSQWTSNPCHRMQEGDWYSFLFGIFPQAHTMWSSRSSHSTPCNCLGQLSLQQIKQEMLFSRDWSATWTTIHWSKCLTEFYWFKMLKSFHEINLKIDGNDRNGQARKNRGATG